MKVNERPAYNIQVRVKDPMVDRSYGFCLNQRWDRPFGEHILEMDVFEFKHLYEAVCDMKNMIEEERQIHETRNYTRIN